MKSRTATLLIAYLVCGSALLIPPAAAEGGLQLAIFMGSPLLEAGDTLTIEVLATIWDAEVDPENVSASWSYLGGETPIALNQTAKGRFIGDFSIPAPATFYHFGISIRARATVGQYVATADATYTPVDNASGSFDWPPPGWRTVVDVVGPRGASRDFVAGDLVTVRTRTYFGGAAADPPRFDATVVWSDEDVGQGEDNREADHVNFVSQDVGIGRRNIDVQIPPGLLYPRHFVMDLNRFGGGAFTSIEFFAQPFNASVSARPLNASWYRVTVMAADAAPLAGAAVEIEGSRFAWDFDTPDFDPTRLTTDASGVASLDVEVPYGAFGVFDITVSTGGRTAYLKLAIDNESLDALGAVPDDYFRTWLLPGTERYGPGDTATVEIAAWQDGIPFAARGVTVLLERAYYGEFLTSPGADRAFNSTTDAEGHLVFSYVVPADWTPLQRLIVTIVRDDGNYSREEAYFGGLGLFDWRGFIPMTCEANATARQVRVESRPSFPEHLTVAVEMVEVRASIAPTHAAFGDLLMNDGVFPGATLGRQADGSWMGLVDVPGARPAGTYSCAAVARLVVRNAYEAFEIDVYNETSLTLETLYIPPAPAASSTVFWLFPLLAVGALGAAWTVLRWRKREAAP